MSLQRNVHQQNDLTFNAMFAKARHFRVEGVPVGVRDFFAKQRIDTNKAVIIQAAEGCVLGLSFGMGGILVTADERFIAFELELDATLTKVIFVHEFADVSSQQNLSSSNRGTGKGYGAVAIEVLHAMNLQSKT